jgi:hypothetical protein
LEFFSNRFNNKIALEEKDKLSKMDIVGFLSKKGELAKDDIGKIEILDFMSFVAVKKRSPIIC